MSYIYNTNENGTNLVYMYYHKRKYVYVQLSQDMSDSSHTMIKTFP